MKVGPNPNLTVNKQVKLRLTKTSRVKWYYSNPEITVHSTYAKIRYFYHLTRPGSLIIVFGTFWDPLTLRTQLLVTE